MSCEKDIGLDENLGCKLIQRAFHAEQAIHITRKVSTVNPPHRNLSVRIVNRKEHIFTGMAAACISEMDMGIQNLGYHTLKIP